MENDELVDWVSLDARIVTMIASYLEPTDLYSLRVSCRFFRRLIPVPSTPPLLTPPHSSGTKSKPIDVTPSHKTRDEGVVCDSASPRTAKGQWTAYMGSPTKKSATLSKHRALFSIMHMGKVEFPKPKPTPPSIPPKPKVTVLDEEEFGEFDEKTKGNTMKLKRRLHRKCKSIGNRSKFVGANSPARPGTSPMLRQSLAGKNDDCIGVSRLIGPTKAQRDSARLRRVRAGTLPPQQMVFLNSAAGVEGLEEDSMEDIHRDCEDLRSKLNKGRTALSHDLLPLGAGADSTDEYSQTVLALDPAYLRFVGQPSPDKSLELLLNPEKVDLSGGNIQYLPDALVLEDELREIYLDGNAFRTLPQELSRFVGLKSMSVSDNYLWGANLDWSTLNNLTYLDLSRNSITRLPSHLSKLYSLRTLNVSDNFITDLQRGCLALSLHTILARNNILWRIPVDLEHLTLLKLLDVRGNRLHSINGENVTVKGSAPHVEVLADTYRSLLRLGKESLVSVKRSSLAWRELAELPLIVLSLRQLVRLDLSHNHLARLPFEVKTLKHLEDLCLDHNNFRSLPLPAGRMPSLESLSMCHNSMTILRVAPAPGEDETNLFSSLRRLQLGHNEIEDVMLPMKTLLPKVSELHLDNNLLVGLPSHCLPPRLTVLDLSFNRLKTLSNVSFAPSLHTIRLKSNLLSQLPIGLAECKHLLRLDVTDNPLDCIPSGVLENTDTTDVFEYLATLTEDCRPLNISKLVVFGDSTVGKSQFLRGLRRITNTNEQNARFGSLRPAGRSTRQVVRGGSRTGSKKERTLWQPFPDYPFRFSISKFKSPIEYHVHRFLFQSLNSIYVLVFHMGRPHEFDSMIAKWVNSVQEWAPSTSLFLVGMHLDPHQPDPKGYLQFINKKLQAIIESHIRRLPEERRIKIESCVIQMEEAEKDKGYNFRRFTADLSAGQMAKTKISVVESTDDGEKLCFWPVTGGQRSALYEQLRHRLVDVALSIPAVLQQVPQQYEPMQQFVEDKARDLAAPLMPWSDVLEWGKSWEMDEGMVKRVIQQLQHAGFVLYIPDTNTILSDHVIVDPTVIFRITGALVPVMKRGVVELDELLRAWAEYPAVMHRFLLQLMLYYDIVVSVGVGTKGVRYLSPLFLPEERPSVITCATFRPGMVARTYCFPVVLPVSFMTSLFRRLLQFTGADHLWQTGCMLRLSDEIALVECVSLNNAERNKCSTELQITCFSSVGHPPTTLFQPVILALESMCMDWYSRLRNMAEVYAPCTSCLKKEVERPHRFHVEQCIGQFMEEENDNVDVRFECPVDGDHLPATWLIPELRSPFAGMEEDMQHPGFSIAELDQGESMGEGSYAQVYRAHYKLVGMPVVDVAIKKTRSFMVSLPSLVEFQNEVALLRLLDHPKVIRLYHAYIRPPSIISEFLALGSLDRYIYEPKVPLSDGLRLRLALDIAEGVACMHTQKTPILHRDLKSANILVASLDPRAHVCAKICDLGLSVAYTGNESKGTNDNPRWTAPEVLQGKPYTPKSDVYAFAMVVYEIVASCLPFDDDTFEFVVRERAMKGDRPEIPSNCHPALKKLLQSCWHQDPVRRPHLIDVLPSMRSAVKTELGVTDEELQAPAIRSNTSSPFRGFPTSPVPRPFARAAPEQTSVRASPSQLSTPESEQDSGPLSPVRLESPEAEDWPCKGLSGRANTIGSREENEQLCLADGAEDSSWTMASRPSRSTFALSRLSQTSKSSDSLRLPERRVTLIGGREPAAFECPVGSLTARTELRASYTELAAPSSLSDSETKPTRSSSNN